MSKRFVFFIAFVIGLMATWSYQANALELCVAKRGAVRVALENRPCKAKETAITVGEMGTAGVQGPAGPQGPQGPAGTNGLDGADGAPGAPGASSGLEVRDALGTRLGILMDHGMSSGSRMTLFDDINNVTRLYDPVSGDEIIAGVNFWYELPNCAGPKLVLARRAQTLAQNFTDLVTVAPGTQPFFTQVASIREDSGVCKNQGFNSAGELMSEVVVLTINDAPATGPLFVTPPQP